MVGEEEKEKYFFISSFPDIEMQCQFKSCTCGLLLQIKRNNDSGHCEGYFLNLLTIIKVNGKYKKLME